MTVIRALPQMEMRGSAAIARSVFCAAAPTTTFPYDLRSAVRFGNAAGDRSSSLGIRVARTLAP